MFDRRRRRHMLAHGMGEVMEAFGAVLADPRDGGYGQPHAEQISHQPSAISHQPSAISLARRSSGSNW
jgi:hypothetical protein